MQLTPQAMAPVEPVRAALRQLQCIVLQEDTFDPATVERAFTLVIPGSVRSYLIPRLLALLRREAPGVCLSPRGMDYGTVLQELDTDQIDLGIGVIMEGQANHKIRALYRFDQLCLYNAKSLSVPTPISLDDYVHFPHIMTSMTVTDRGLVDIALASIGRKRRLVATTPLFTTVAFRVQPTPVIATMVDKLANNFAGQLEPTANPVPVPHDEFTQSMVWHASYDQDPPRRWLRGALVRLDREVERDHTGGTSSGAPITVACSLPPALNLVAGSQCTAPTVAPPPWRRTSASFKAT